MAYYDASGGTSMADLIRREAQKIAEKESRAGQYEESPYQIISETLDRVEQNKMWQARKNEQLQKLLEVQAKGFEDTYSTKTAGEYRDKVANFIERNQNNFDDITSEYANAMLSNIDMHKEKVSNFHQSVGQLDQYKQDWLATAQDYYDRSGGEGQELEASDYKHLQEEIGNYVAFKKQMLADHADFLDKPQFSHVYTDMVGHEKVVKDLLQQARDGQALSAKEFEVFSDAVRAGDTSIIDEFKEQRKILQKDMLSDQLSDVKSAYENYSMYEQLLNEDKGEYYAAQQMFIGDDVIAEGSTITLEGLDIDREEAENLRSKAELELKRVNEIYKTKTGDDYIWERENRKDGVATIPSVIKLLQKSGLSDEEIRLMSDEEKHAYIDDNNLGPTTDEEKEKKKKEKDSKWPDILTGIGALGYGAYKSGAAGKIAEVSKIYAEQSIEAGKYVFDVAKNIDPKDIKLLLNDKAIEEALEDIKWHKDYLDEQIKKGPSRNETKRAEKAYDKVVKRHAQAMRSSGKIKINSFKASDTPGEKKILKAGKRGTGKKVPGAIKTIKQAELIELLKNPNKWRTYKLLNAIYTAVPATAQNKWLQRAGKGSKKFLAFDMGRRITEGISDAVIGEGMASDIISIAGGGASMKYAPQVAAGGRKAIAKAMDKTKKALANKIATAGGRKAVINKIRNKALKRAATYAFSGMAAGGGTPLSGAGAIIGTGLAIGLTIYDIYDLLLKDD